jgi:hypothetical protein
MLMQGGASNPLHFFVDKRSDVPISIPEPKRQDFKSEKAYLDALDTWVQIIEEDGDSKLEKFLNQRQNGSDNA